MFCVFEEHLSLTLVVRGGKDEAMKIKGLYHMRGTKHLWFRWMVDGKRYAVSLKTADLGEAQKKIKEIKAGALVARWDTSI